MIVIEGKEDTKAPAAAQPLLHISSAQMGAMPHSLGHLTADLQERLVLTTANNLLRDLKELLKTATVDYRIVQDIAIKICALNCSITSKCRNIQLWNIFQHNCKVRKDKIFSYTICLLFC